jgi:hypothetical protein
LTGSLQELSEAKNLSLVVRSEVARCSEERLGRFVHLDAITPVIVVEELQWTLIETREVA